ncbi:uncharacterized protein, partial [Primulina eburnea]|uniref:uncharacterized protein n=1 Tax=Primulina eburnea TaxID=1245227 RepID=UPI003C6C0243
ISWENQVNLQEIPTTGKGNSLQQPKAPPDPRPDPYYIRTIVYLVDTAYGCDRELGAAAEVVSDCVTQCFQYTLKEAKAGDIAMQVLVGRMYYSGYGVPRDAQKGRTRIGRASRIQCGKLAISIQVVIMRVTRILMIPRKMSKKIGVSKEGE